MILAPIKVHESMRELTGNLMTFSYIIGLTSGSFASYSLHDWINQHSPQVHFDNYTYVIFAENCTDFLNDLLSNDDLFHGAGGVGNQTSLSNITATTSMPFVNTSNLLQNVAPELLQNSSVFASSFYHF